MEQVALDEPIANGTGNRPTDSGDVPAPALTPEEIHDTALQLNGLYGLAPERREMRVDLTRRSLKSAADSLASERVLTQPGFFFDAPAVDDAVAAPSIKRQEDQPTLWAHKPVPEITPEETTSSSGLKGKAKATLGALRLLKQLEAENRLPSPSERRILAGFSGFGMLANHIFPEPGTDRYKAGWEELGNSLVALLSADEYESAKRSTFNAFYTAPQIMQAVYQAVARMGVPASGIQALEPGCGIGNFISAAPEGMNFIAVEKEVLSGRIARLLHPDHDIRIEPFQKSAIPSGSIDLVVGNVPFSDLSLKWQEKKLSLHDYFFAKSLDSLHAGGILALVTSRYTLDKQDSSFREVLAESADFLGAIRLPKGAFRQEGTEVVTDIVFLRKRGKEQTPSHAGDWLQTASLPSGTAHVNGYFGTHPEMVIGELDEDQGMYGDHELTVRFPADFAERLANAVAQLPANVFTPSLSPARIAGVTAKQTALSAVNSSRRTLPGSLFVQPDGQIMSVLDTAGNAEPLTYGNTPVSSLSGIVGTRLAGLIAIRDAARHVLDTQREGKPVAERDAARVLLNRRYDAFVRKWGAINKTTISYLKDGTPVRRQPNLTGFRDDPDVYLVMALEQYDEKTDSARKMPMLERDVIGSTPPVEQVTSALDGLLVSLNQTGKVDLRLIASLYGASEETVIDELGSHIFYDPLQERYVTAEEYLSGNVREKLRLANEGSADPRIGLGIQPLSDAQPEPVPPGDIDVTLGASWIPEEMVQGFVAQLLGCPVEQVIVRHVGREALWQVSVPDFVHLKAESISTYGTAERPAITLINDALNMGVPTVMQMIRTSDGDRQVIDQEATLAAREKQKAIKSAFQSWLFADPARADTLTERYNRLFNTTRLRHYDGSHLTFPGMNPEISLRPHQQDAIWRVMSSRNSLLAHAVGAGKTFEMIAAGMKMKQTGLIRKPLFVVPNHMLEQFSREFYILYPNAKLLVASKDDLAKEKRRLLTAKCASGEWDGIIMTHSSFEKIGMSPGFQTSFVKEQIREYEDLLLDMKGGSNSDSKRLLKRIEKQKESWEERLEELAAQDKKDLGLTFEELGVDHLFMDEAHLFKNLETPTKMGQVAGVQTDGSLRAFDLFMKARYLDGHGHGTTFATGTPVSNSMVEMYTMSRFLAPELLHERGIDHFDGWAAVFGDIVDTIELSPDAQSLRQNRRFARFVNLPELLQIFHSFADVKTADMLDLPCPKLKNGKPTILATPMNPHQRKIQESLVSRYERVRSGTVKPKEDNALNITTDGRKLALDSRLVYPHLPESPGKIDALVENVHTIWQRTTESKATQMIFCDLGVSGKDGQFSVYQDIIKKLIAAGIPAREIANIGDYDTDIKKARLFAQLRSGDIRIVLGSTQKMGTGTNAQHRLYALHHLDAPWKPAEVEQREGRILRQGNTHPEVEIFRYVIEGSFDAYMWQTLQTKAEFINQVMKGDLSIRRIEDMDEQSLSYAEVKAIASGNPAVLTLAKLDMEVQRLTQLARAQRNEQYRIRQTIRQIEDADLATLTQRQQRIASDLATLSEHGGIGSPVLTIDGKVMNEAKAAQDALRGAVEQQWEILAFRLEAASEGSRERAPIGSFGGLEIQLLLEKSERISGTLALVGDYRTSRPLRGAGSDRLLAYLHELVAGLPQIAEQARVEQVALETRLDGLQTRLGLPFEHEARLSQLSAMRSELQMLLQSDAPARSVHDNAAEPESSVTATTPVLAPEVVKERIQMLVAAFDAMMKEGLPSGVKSSADSQPATAQQPPTPATTRRWSESLRPIQRATLHLGSAVGL